VGVRVFGWVDSLMVSLTKAKEISPLKLLSLTRSYDRSLWPRNKHKLPVICAFLCNELGKSGSSANQFVFRSKCVHRKAVSGPMVRVSVSGDIP